MGKKMKTGKFSGTDKVLCQSEIWIAQFVDENGKLKRVSTKTKDKSAANRVLAKYESEVSMIRAGLTAISVNDWTTGISLIYRYSQLVVFLAIDNSLGT